MMRMVKAEDLYQYRFVSQPKWSPDGVRAVFVGTSCDEKKNAYSNNLYLWDGEVRQLTSAGDVKSAQWLDEHTLLFSALRSEEDKKAAKDGALTVFYALDLRGGEAYEYLRLPLKGASVKPLGGGRWAALAKFDRNADESPDYEVFDEIPFWYNGKGYLSGKRDRLYVVENGVPTAITSETEQVAGWAVKDGTILFAMHEFIDMEGNTDGVFTWKDGVRTTLVEDGAWKISGVNFLGETPVALMNDMKSYGLSQNDLFYALDGAEPRLLAEADEQPGDALIGDCAYGGGELVTAADGAIWYGVIEGTGTAIRKLSADGLETVFRTDAEIDAFAVSGGRLLACAVTADCLPELYLLENGTLRPLTDFNAEMRERTISKPIPLSAQSDGWRIDGFVLPPADYDPSKTYPAILDVHGGPKAAYGAQFFHEMQVWAGAGYFVFFCNPRGGEGRGNEFADLRGQYGKIDYDDIMAFTEEVLRRYPQIDRKRLGITGGSYGGFMTNWAIGHTNLFSAAATQRCVTNWITKYLCTDIGYRYNGDLLQGDPWNDTEKLWWHSPLKYADKATTPTLFIHSDQDYRCWLAEGLQMMTALRLHGVPVRMCLFHGEHHGLSRVGKPQHRVRRLNEITAWMDKYLK